MANIFLSYRRDDSKAHARALYERLKTQFGEKRIFIDVSDIPLGNNDFQKTIEDRIARSDVFISVIAERWLSLTDKDGKRRLDRKDDPVRVEIREALYQQVAILPLLIGQTTSMPEAEELPEDIRRFHVAQSHTITYEHFDRDLDILVEAVRRLLREARAKRWRGRAAAVREFLQRHLKWPRWLALAGVIIAAVALCFSAMRYVDSFLHRMLRGSRPDALSGLRLPNSGHYFPSPAEWRDEVLYYVLPDRFSDGQESSRQLLDRKTTQQPARDLVGWMKEGQKWQGGTIQGIQSKLDYLQKLGVTAIWLGPVQKQRKKLDTYHGFAIQDFLDVDSRFGSRSDLVDLVRAAHARGVMVILTAVINHSGTNWLYPPGTPGDGAPGDGVVIARYTTQSYPFGSWLSAEERPLAGVPVAPNDGVWPREFQDPEMYVRAGFGGNFEGTEGLRCDFVYLRKFNFSNALKRLIEVYKYWIALTDCDGLQIDAAAQVGSNNVGTFSKEIREYAGKLGKNNFLVVAEIASSPEFQDGFLDNLWLSARLELSAGRNTLRKVALGNEAPSSFFDQFARGKDVLAQDRLRGRVVTLIDDLDNVFSEKMRFGASAISDHQVTAAAALLLFTPGIPAIYYGTEQSLGTPAPDTLQTDVLLRETMFGGRFGAFGTAGQHVFDANSAAYVRIAALLEARRKYPALRRGEFAVADTRTRTHDFGPPITPREIVAWSRVLDAQRILCLVNTDGGNAASAQVMINRRAEPLTVVVNTMQAATAKLGAYDGPLAVGSSVPVKIDGDRAYISIDSLGPSEVVVLTARRNPEDM